MPRGPVRHELLVKPAVYPDGTANMPAQPDPQGKANTGATVTLTLHMFISPFPSHFLPLGPGKRLPDNSSAEVSTPPLTLTVSF